MESMQDIYCACGPFLYVCMGLCNQHTYDVHMVYTCGTLACFQSMKDETLSKLGQLSSYWEERIHTYIEVQ